MAIHVSITRLSRACITASYYIRVSRKPVNPRWLPGEQRRSPRKLDCSATVACRLPPYARPYPINRRCLCDKVLKYNLKNCKEKPPRLRQSFELGTVSARRLSSAAVTVTILRKGKENKQQGCALTVTCFWTIIAEQIMSPEEDFAARHQ